MSTVHDTLIARIGAAKVLIATWEADLAKLPEEVHSMEHSLFLKVARTFGYTDIDIVGTLEGQQAVVAAQVLPSSSSSANTATQEEGANVISSLTPLGSSGAGSDVLSAGNSGTGWSSSP